MDLNLGGPVWHASIAFHGPARGLSGIAGARLHRALRLIRGVGDESLGQWIEHTTRATHVRRRLTKQESTGLTLVDIRGTDEATRRLDVVRPLLPLGWTE
jgi:sugar/nucleoside kinase (ribokinase family)